MDAKIEKHNQLIREQFPIGKICWYYNDYALVKEYRTDDSGQINLIVANVEATPRPMLKYISVTSKGLKPFRK